MNNKKTVPSFDDEINLSHIFAKLWQRRGLILVVTIMSLFFSVILILFMKYSHRIWNRSPRRPQQPNRSATYFSSKYHHPTQSGSVGYRWRFTYWWHPFRCYGWTYRTASGQGDTWRGHGWRKMWTNFSGYRARCETKFWYTSRFWIKLWSQFCF